MLPTRRIDPAAPLHRQSHSLCPLYRIRRFFDNFIVITGGRVKFRALKHQLARIKNVGFDSSKCQKSAQKKRAKRLQITETRSLSYIIL